MPVSLEKIALFLSAAVFVTLSPGPDVLGTLSIGLSRGRRPAMGFGIGCACGCLSHTALAALGISALVTSSPVAFTILKWCGAAYLVWLASGALRSHGAKIGTGEHRDESVGVFFRRGLIANAINPKVAVFFLAFLPQFITADAGETAVQTAFLGVLFTLQAVVVFGAIGFFSGSCGRLLQTRPGVSIWLDRIAGAVFLLLALMLVLPERR